MEKNINEINKSKYEDLKRRISMAGMGGNISSDSIQKISSEIESSNFLSEWDKKVLLEQLSNVYHE